MKKLVVLLALAVLTFPVFALNASTPEAVDEHIGQLVHNVITLSQDTQEALNQGYNITGEEERNQHGTAIRERLERAYQKLFNENPEVATELYFVVIQPISPNIQCDTIVIGSAARKKLQKATVTAETLEGIFKSLETTKAHFEELVAGFNGDANMIGQQILSYLERDFKNLSETEQAIWGRSYATYQVDGTPLVDAIQNITPALKGKWHQSAIYDLVRFGFKVQMLSE